MPLSKEQVAELKKQLKEQVQQLPADKKAEAIKQIDNMSDEAIETLLLQQQEASQGSSQPIFRAIVSGEIPSRKLDENKQAIAVLSVKPISKGHTIIIPKTPITNQKDIPTQAFTLAKKIAKKIFSKLKSKGCEIQNQIMFGEIIINVIPIYDKPLDMSKPPKDADEKELDGLYQKLRVIKKPKTIKLNKKSKQKKLIKYPKRLP